MSCWTYCKPSNHRMVQVALIDLLVDLHDKSAVPQFRKFQQDPKVDPTVKKRVDWGIQQLS